MSAAEAQGCAELDPAKVRRIAVLRANGIGDFVFTLPALAALRARFPDAHLSLLGKAWHAAFLPGRGVVDEVIELPPIPGVGAPPAAPGYAAATEALCAKLRARHFDLACQLHGGGRYSNPLMQRLGARCTIGLRADDAPALDRWIPYVPWHNERLRLLEVVGLVGAAPVSLDPRLAVLARDRHALEAALALPAAPLAVLNPGASDPRRRWPPTRFAAVGDALAHAGAQVVVQGSTDECTLTAAVVAAMKRPAIDAGGRLSLGALTALLARARLLVSNDSGPLHLAEALGTATVGIYWLTNLLAFGPVTAARHRYLVALRLACPVCGAENLRTRCPHDASFVAEISTEEVVAQALALWHPAHAPHPAAPSEAASGPRPAPH